MARQAPDSSETVAILDKNQNQKVHVRILEYYGKRYVDLRVFSGDFPTKKGVAIDLEQLPELIKALERAGETAIEAEDDPLSKQYRAIMAGNEDDEQGKAVSDLNDLAEGATILGGG